jgi:lipopolysaccharide biosynthesis protein
VSEPASTSTLRALAFYLPQFHRIAENDAWWGSGFTEWTNVTRARPLFAGHEQPHLPADLGFYDLRVPEVRSEQAALARRYGIDGFCYYHYWFNGRRVLERPVQDLLSGQTPDFPFCLCWANENWTRRWDGNQREVLLEQRYSAEDDIAHIRSLIPAFQDRRYIRHEGKPLLLVFRASQLPDAAGTFSRWRAQAIAAGLPGLHICCVEGFAEERGMAQRSGADAAVAFAPDWGQWPPRAGQRWPAPTRHWPFLRWRRRGAFDRHYVAEYAELARSMLDEQSLPSGPRYRCVTPMWDNTARKKADGFIALHSSPERYERWLGEAVRRSRQEHQPFVFINAWNEWAEGCHLEPCQRWGHAYLEATRRALGL